jgi:hypothetical protein
MNHEKPARRSRNQRGEENLPQRTQSTQKRNEIRRGGFETRPLFFRAGDDSDIVCGPGSRTGALQTALPAGMGVPTQRVA